MMDNIFDLVIGQIKYKEGSSGSCVITKGMNDASLIITALHLFSMDKEPDWSEFTVFREIQGKKKPFNCEVIGFAYDEIIDVALIHVSTSENVVTVNTTLASLDMKEITLCGFPGKLENASPITRYELKADIKQILANSIIIEITSPIQNYLSEEHSNLVGFSGGGIFYCADDIVLLGIENKALTKEVSYNALNVASISCIESIIEKNKVSLKLDSSLTFFRNDYDFEIDRLKASSIYMRSFRILKDIELNLADSRLEKEYRAGVNAHPEHIRRGFDVDREYWQKSLETAFCDNQIVVLRGASGQGKSSLAYRFLLNHYEESHVICIQGDVQKDDIWDICKMVKSLKHGRHLIAYMDVDPGNTDWINMVRSWSDSIKDIPLLITLREDDYNRSNFDKNKYHAYELELRMSQEEAYDIFKKYEALSFASFEESWVKFGGHGPLMEYIYLITHSENLKDRIEAQLENIEKTGYDKEWAELLSVIALAGKYNLSVNIRKLFSIIRCKNQRALIKHLENEMLIRVSDDQSHLMGLHALRSALIFEILEREFYVSKEHMVVLLCSIVDDNLMLCIVDYFSQAPSLKPFLNNISKTEFAGPRSYASVLIALLWLEVHSFKQINNNAIIEGNRLFNNQFGPIARFDITGMIGGKDVGMEVFESLDRITPGIKEAYISIENRFVMKQLNYQYIDSFLRMTFASIYNFLQWDNDDYTAIGYILYWAGKRGFFIKEEEIDTRNIECISTNNMEGCLDLMLGVWEQRLYSLFSRIKSIITPQIFDYYGILSYKKVDGEVYTNFYIEPSSKSFSFNECCMRVENAFHRYDPDAKKYHTHYLGVNNLGFFVPDTEKHLSTEQMYYSWSSELNAIFRRMNEYDVAPESWEDVLANILTAREHVKNFLEELLLYIEKWYAQKPAKNLNKLNRTEKSCKEASVFNPFVYPKSYIDKHGIVVSKITESNYSLSHEYKEKKVSAIDVDIDYVISNPIRNDSILDMCSDYFRSINIFATSVGTFLKECRNGLEQSQISRNVYYSVVKALNVLPELQKKLRSYFSNYSVEFNDDEEYTVLEKIAAVIQYMFLNKYFPSKNIGYTAMENVKKRRKHIDSFFNTRIASCYGVTDVQYRDKIITIELPAEALEQFIEVLYQDIHGLTDNMSSISMDGYYVINQISKICINLTIDGNIIISNKEFSPINFLIGKNADNVLQYSRYSGDISACSEDSSMNEYLIRLYLLKNMYSTLNDIISDMRVALSKESRDYHIASVINKIDSEFLCQIKEINDKVREILEHIKKSDYVSDEYGIYITEVTDNFLVMLETNSVFSGNECLNQSSIDLFGRIIYTIAAEFKKS